MGSFLSCVCRLDSYANFMWLIKYSQNSALCKLKMNWCRSVQHELCLQPSQSASSFPNIYVQNLCVFCHAAHCSDRREWEGALRDIKKWSFTVPGFALLISFSLWEKTSAAGAGLVMSDFVAPQLWQGSLLKWRQMLQRPSSTEAWWGLSSLYCTDRQGGRVFPHICLTCGK